MSGGKRRRLGRWQRRPRGLDTHSLAALYRMVRAGGSDEPRVERGVAELVEAVKQADKKLAAESPRPTTEELWEDAIVAMEGYQSGSVGPDRLDRESRRRLLRELPEPVLRALLVAFDWKRRRRLDPRARDLLTLAFGQWIMSEERRWEIVEELGSPSET